VDQPIEDRIGKGRITQAGMPLLDRKLAGEDRGFLVVAIIKDFQQIALGVFRDRRDAEVVDEQQIDLGEAAKEAGAVVAASGFSFSGSTTDRARWRASAGTA
jgi:hypothetical protein